MRSLELEIGEEKSGCWMKRWVGVVGAVLRVGVKISESVLGDCGKE